MADITDNEFVNAVFHCKLCGKEIPNKKNWRRHYMTHSTDFQHFCSHCGKGFREQYMMKRHMTKCKVKTETVFSS